ncbi:MAG: glycoside hydrolase family 3 N-terminal domain-containing protein [Bacteroidota bacterium]
MDQRNKYHSTKKCRLLIIIVVIIISLPSRSIAQIYLDSTATIEVRVADLLSKMTLDEKIGQMIQMNYPDLPLTSDIKTYYLGSLLAYADNGPAGRTPQAWADLYNTLQNYALQTRLKIPLIFALDAVHGFGAMYGATVFPHNIGLGCTRNPQLVDTAEQITAQEMSATGIDWALGPVVAVARDERWGRTYESFGEDPNLVKEMAGPAVHGFQGDTSAKNVNILACAKHFIGDGGTSGGVTNGNTVCDEQTLRTIHLPGYISTIEQKVGSIMVAQNQWNGIHPHGYPYLLDTLLKKELGFKGIVISDANSFMYAGDPTVPYPSRILYGAAIKHSINAGVDMAMMSNFIGFNHRTYIDTLKTLISHGDVTIERIDDAVKRILTQKFRLGLFEHPYADRSHLSQVGSQAHRQVARECVRQSLVVLKKKDGILPISKTIKRIHMTGRHANNMGYQCGGWTITWQGGSGNTTIGTTIMQAVQNSVPNAEVTYSENGFSADSADLGIAVIGELPYAEGSGDGGLSLDPQDIQTIRNLKNYNIPVIVILISGRPMIINPILHYCDALIAAWLPGTEGEGITDVLFGDYQPTGILSQTWPKNVSQIPINVGDLVYDPLFAYGYGITSFNDSPVGSPPEVYSAGTTLGGNAIEISFNKKMTAPPVSSSGFSVLVDGTTPMTITHICLKPNDSTTMVLTFVDSLKKGSAYSISYVPGNIQSHDYGQLAAFENLSVYNLLNDYINIQVVPNKVEAEKCFARQGSGAASISDDGDGSALTFSHDGGWADYLINVSQSGKYALEYRISSAKDTGQIQMIAKGTNVPPLNLPVTGSWSAWQTVSTTIGLSEGPQMIRMSVLHGGFWLNWIQLSLSTGVRDIDSRVVKEFHLSQNYPNPFNPTTTIKYQVPKTSAVTLIILDVLGREVAFLLNEEKSAGDYNVKWNASNLSSGVYFYRLHAGSFLETKKMILLK